MIQNDNLKSYSLQEFSLYKIHGRTDESQYPLPLFWTNSGIEVNVTGSELWIDVEVDFYNYEPWIAIEIDGAFISRQMLLPGRYSICLFRKMKHGIVKNVKFYRELQATSRDDESRLLVYGLKHDGEFLPIVEKKIKLEFIGDSITSGEGTYGSKTSDETLNMYLSASKNYALLTAKALDAECRILSQGGWGVLSSWGNNPYANIPEYYEKICGLAFGSINESLGAGKPYDFSSWEADAIVVNLGTNDAIAFDQPAWVDPESGEIFQQGRNEDGSYKEEDIERFKQAVIQFLYKIRKNNPKSRIVWVYGMMGYDLLLAITDAVNRYQRETKDNNTDFLALPSTSEKTVGTHGHPGPACHELAANVLADYLKKYL